MKRLICAILGLGLAFAGPARRKTLIKLRVAYDGFSMTSAPLNYAGSTRHLQEPSAST